MELLEFAKIAVGQEASDMFVKAFDPPALRVHGAIKPLNFPPFTPEDTKRLAYEVMSDGQKAQFERELEMDLAFSLPGLCRFRVNVFQERGNVGMALRLIPFSIRTIEELGLPTILNDISLRRQGLTLVTGPTGCGKSTSLAAMLEVINNHRHCHIVTIEDPIEYVHEDKMAMITQREVGIDTHSFSDALKRIVRQSPDVILIGEMRDPETFHVALTCAETGHLVFSTVHTTSAAETLERIINMFPPHDKPQICLRISISLVAIISQKLLPRADGTGRVAAVEVMVGTPTIKQFIEDGRTSELYGAIKEGGFWGMQTMNQALLNYYRDGIITDEEALANAGNEIELRQMIRRV